MFPNYEKFMNTFEKREKDILNLKPDWNGIGSCIYAKNTFDLSKSFIFSLYNKMWDDHNLSIEIPYIYGGREGSIDFEWENTSFSLIISISEEINNCSAIYGLNKLNQKELLIDFYINNTKEILETIVTFLKESNI